MLSSDGFCASGCQHHAGLFTICFPSDGFVFFSSPKERTWRTKPKERTTRPTLTRPLSTLRATTRTQRRRRNTSFRLQREPCRSRLLLTVPLCFLLSHSVSHVRPSPLATARSTQQGVCRKRRSSRVIFIFIFFIGASVSAALLSSFSLSFHFGLMFLTASVMLLLLLLKTAPLPRVSPGLFTWTPGNM